MSNVARWYPSKLDRWLAVMLAIGPVFSLVAMVALAATGPAGAVVGLAPVALFAVIYGGLVFPMRYGMTDDTLVVRYGLVHKRIALRDISEVRPTRNPLSSPALSLDRLHIQYGAGMFKAIMISPADKQGFLAELAERAGLRRDGERLVR